MKLTVAELSLLTSLKIKMRKFLKNRAVARIKSHHLLTDTLDEKSRDDSSLISNQIKADTGAECNFRTIQRHLKGLRTWNDCRGLTFSSPKDLPFTIIKLGMCINGRKCYSSEKNFNLDGPDGFQRYWYAKDVSEENFSIRHSRGEGSFSYNGTLELWEV